MPVSEAARTDLYNALSKAIGPDNTETLMGAVAWYTMDEVATKGDLATLRGELGSEIAELRAELHREIAALQKTISTWMLTLTVTVIGAIAGVAFLT